MPYRTPDIERFGKLSPTNGGAIQVCSGQLSGTLIVARFLLNDGTTFFRGFLRITKGKLINAPKATLHEWITACGRGENDLRGAANDRNSVYGFRTGGVTNLHFTDLGYSSTASDSRDWSPAQSEEGSRRRDVNHSLPPPRGRDNARTSCGPHPIERLRASDWMEIPNGPGVYWWYFPQRHLELFGIAHHCDADGLRLRRARSGRLCLYVGIAKSLRKRIKWHAAQPLRQSTLRSGWLSTLRFSLLALGKLNYNSGDAAINRLMDELSVSWASTQGKPEADLIEASELRGGFHFPLNIRDNHRLETARFVEHLQELRRVYRKQYL